jgi:ribose transport system substrate-binding protein
MQSKAMRPKVWAKRVVWSMALLCSVFLLLACSLPNAGSARRKITIAWVSKSLGNPVFEMGQRGALQKAKELTEQGPIDVELLLVGPAAADAIEQTRIMDDLIARGVDGIAVSCNDPDVCAAPIDRAVSAGIAVMTWDSDSPNSQRFSFLSIDNYQSGRIAADLLAESIEQRGKVAVITGVPGALNLQQRVDGFQDRIAEAYPDMEIVRIFISNEDINLGVQGVEETMQAHPDLRGWFFAGMWPLFADRGSMPLWEAAARSGQVKTIAFDALPLELELLQDGYIDALIAQKYWDWGYQSVQMVYDYVEQGTPYPSYIDMGVEIINQQNVQEALENWRFVQTPQPASP